MLPRRRGCAHVEVVAHLFGGEVGGHVAHARPLRVARHEAGVIAQQVQRGQAGGRAKSGNVVQRPPGVT